MASAMLPSARALVIPELLEMVLDHATPQDLLLWQRVNKAWQAAIRSSPRIQEKLFFRVRKLCNTAFDEKCMIENPYLKSFAHERGFMYLFFDDAFDRKKASHPTASWRQMYLRSPALTRLEAVRMIDNGYWMEAMAMGVNCPIACETGVTIGQLADALKEYRAHHIEACEVAEFLIRIIP